MNIKRLTQRIIIGLLIIFSGIALLLDGLNVTFDGAINHWYLVAIITIAAISLAIAIINKSSAYLVISFILGGIFLAWDVAINIDTATFVHTWPIITLMMGVGLFLSGLIAKKKKYLFLTGTSLAILSAMLLAALITNTVNYILPIMVILIGLYIILYNIISRGGKKNLNNDDKDYYVRPSNENK